MIYISILIANMVEEAIILPENQSVILKRVLAKMLYNINYDQLEISKILNLSQPMVSNYCRSNQKNSDEIISYAKKIVDKITKGQNINFHISVNSSDKIIKGNYFIAEKNEIINDEKTKIINNLTEAFLIIKEKNLNGLIPKVKINVAMSKDNPLDVDDIAAFQNGLIIIDEHIASNNGIRFGKSKHLSSLILNLYKKINVNSMMNIAYIDEKKLRNYNYEFLSKNYRLKNNTKQLDILLHKGDFGIEPCAYVLGNDAIEVVKKVLKLKEEIKWN